MTIYAGTSAFFANRKGAHNWLDNHERPYLSVIKTNRKGRKTYTDLFLNKHEDVKVMVSTEAQQIAVPAGYVILMHPANTRQPLFRVLAKKEG